MGRPVGEFTIKGPKTQDGRVIVQPASFRGDHNPYWPGRSDNIANGTRGDGDLFQLVQAGAGDPTRTVQFIDSVYVLGGEFRIEGADVNSRATAKLVAPASPVVANGTNTGNANLFATGAGYNLIVPAAGDGTHDVDVGAALNANLVSKARGTPTKVTAVVPVPAIAVDAKGEDQPDGYWNWDEETGEVTASPPNGANKTGWWNLFDGSVNMIRWMADYPLWGADGKLDRSMNDLMAPMKSKKLLPHWQLVIDFHHEGATTLKAVWSLQMGRVESLG